MVTERAAKLRERVALAMDGLMPGEYEPFDSDEAAHVLRAVVEELGVTSEDLVECGCGCGAKVVHHGSGLAVASALATLLEASGAER